MDVDFQGEMDQATENGLDLQYVSILLIQLDRQTIEMISTSYNVLKKDTTGMLQSPLHRFMNDHDINNGFIQLTPKMCQYIFEGIDNLDQPDQHSDTSNTSSIRKLVLALPPVTLRENEHNIVASSNICFDIDSLIAIPRCLSIAKRSLKVYTYI